MSADNGVYILVSPKGSGKEYRVTHAQAIENVTLDPKEFGDMHLYSQVLYFAQSAVFTDRQAALQEAARIHDRVGWTEYGICEIKVDNEFPKYTVPEAEKLLEAEWEKRYPKRDTLKEIL